MAKIGNYRVKTLREEKETGLGDKIERGREKAYKTGNHTTNVRKGCEKTGVTGGQERLMGGK